MLCVLQQQTHYENCQTMRETPRDLLLIAPRPHRKRQEHSVAADITRPSHTPVRSLHPASSSEPQQVLLDPSPFPDVSPSACCTSFVFDPGTVSRRFSASFQNVTRAPAESRHPDRRLPLQETQKRSLVPATQRLNRQATSVCVVARCLS